MKKFIAMLLAVVMVCGVVGSAVARTPEEILEATRYLSAQIDALEASGQASNNEVYSLWVDFSNLSSKSVAMSVYQDGSAIPTNATTFPLSKVFEWREAEQQLVKYALGNIANRYRVEPLNTDITCKTLNPDASPRDTIPFYVYGQYKAEAVAELYNGIPTCFDIVYYPPGTGSGGGHSGSMSQPVDPIETPVADAIEEGTSGQLISVIFAIGNTSVTTSTESITMDVAPYIKNERTYVPVRYLAYTLGVPKEGVTWEQETKRVGITKNETDITLTIGSTVMLVNQVPVQMDVAPELTNGRTMLPARWVAEALGAEVDWDEANQQATIKLPETEPGD